MLLQSNKIDFKGQHIYVGIDVHIKSWKVTVMTEGQSLK
jgi:transposase